MYNKKVMQLFLKPKNVGKMKDYDGLGKVGNILCGDIMWLYIKVAKKGDKEIIQRASFSTFGCVVALANSSLLTTMIKGKTLEEAMKIKKEDLLKKLGKIPPIKMHCSLLAVDALHEAIYDYYKRKKMPIPNQLKDIHNRIEKEKRIIEKKYKEWVKEEERMYKESVI